MRERHARYVQLILVAWGVIFFLPYATASPTGAENTWGSRGTKCVGTERVEYARLWRLSAFGPDWIATCRKTAPQSVSSRADGKIPPFCVRHVDGSVWGKWQNSGHASCETSRDMPDTDHARYGDTTASATPFEHKGQRSEGPGHDRSWKADGAAEIPARPATRESLNAVAQVCVCSPAQSGSGLVLGAEGGPYPAKSSVCRAALHAGAVTAAGGTVILKSVHPAGPYASATRNGVASQAWTNPEGTFDFGKE